MAIKIVRWPAEADLRERLNRLKIPRLLLIDEDSSPPMPFYALEDWVQSPASADELLERVRQLETLARSSVPVLEGTRILHFGGRRTVLSPANASVMRVLIENYPGLVARADLVRDVWSDLPTRNAVDLRLHRLRQRIAEVGLQVRTVPGQGYLLDTVEPDRCG